MVCKTCFIAFRKKEIMLPHPVFTCSYMYLNYELLYLIRSFNLANLVGHFLRIQLLIADSQLLQYKCGYIPCTWHKVG